MLKSLALKAGIDRAVLLTVLARSWSLLAGPLTLWFIAKFLSLSDQGIYYTFGSILAAKVFFELGIGNVVLLTASHEKASLSWGPGGLLEGDPRAFGRLVGIFRTAFKFYAAASLLALVLLLPGGILLLSSGVQGDSGRWLPPWILLCLLTSVGLWSSFLSSLLEGCGLVAKIARVRLISAIAMTIAVWGTLAAGGGLYAAPAAAAADLLVLVCWLLGSKRNTILQLWRALPSDTHGFSWRKEIWPLQWRAALSFGSNYLIFQLFNPLLLYFRGPEEAGRMGMSMNLSWALLTISLAWINTKAAPFGDLVSRRRWRELDQSFFRAMAQSLIVLLLGSGALLALVITLSITHPSYAERLLPPLPFILLLTAGVGNQIWCAYTVYLRAHKQDPFVFLMLTSGVLIASGSWLVVADTGAMGLMAVFACVTWAVGVVAGSTMFFKLRRLWHQEVQSPDARSDMKLANQQSSNE